MIMRIVSVIVVLASIWGCTPAGQTDTRAADEAALRKLIADSEKNFTARDFDKVMEFYAPDAVILFPNRPMITGAAQIKEVMRAAFSDPNVVVTVKPERFVIAASGDVAFGYGTGTATITDPTTHAVTVEQSKWVTTFQKQPNGGWQAVADMYNTDAAAPPPKS
ncbi:MAG TPA: DUF4440 domain-containing protein [Steroidobacteraceae bacterium]|nr:DUF4440 domain-containing protein [Steroidobacteraceae bacterium]